MGNSTYTVSISLGLKPLSKNNVVKRLGNCKYTAILEVQTNVNCE